MAKGTDLTELAVPVVGDGKVFTVAPNGMVSAFDVKSGGTVWSAIIEQVEDEPLPEKSVVLPCLPKGWLFMPAVRLWRCWIR